MEAVRLDFGDFVAQTFKPALHAFPLCSKCGQYRALSTADTLCYGCRNFADLVVCHTCRLYWQKRAKFCQKLGGRLDSTTNKPIVRSEDGNLETETPPQNTDMNLVSMLGQWMRHGLLSKVLTLHSTSR